MFVVSDDGRDAVNLDNAFALSIATLPDGEEGLVAFGPGIQTVLAKGSEHHVAAALHEIIEEIAIDPDRRVFDLREVSRVGPRPSGPSLVVPQPQIPKDLRGDWSR